MFCIFFCCRFFFFCLFSFIKLPPHTQRFDAGAQSLGRCLAAARGARRIQEAPVGAVLDNDSLPVESGTLRVAAPPSLSSADDPGSLAVGSQEDTHTHINTHTYVHTRTHIQTKKKRTKTKHQLPLPSGAPLGDLPGGSRRQASSRLGTALSLWPSLRVPPEPRW